jgi:ribonucleoside-diphosphate reductase alpha chain
MTRQRPPNRRGHEPLGFEHDGIRYTAGIGRFVDGVAKIFRNIAKHGTALDVNARAAAVAAPPLVQYRCPVDTLRQAVTRNSDGSGSGQLTCALDLLVE